MSKTRIARRQVAKVIRKVGVLKQDIHSLQNHPKIVAHLNVAIAIKTEEGQL